MLVSGLFTSKVQYGITAWGNPVRYQEIGQNSMNLGKEGMRKLQVLQNTTLRLLLKKKYDTPTSSLLTESKSLSVNQTVASCMLNQSENRKFANPNIITKDVLVDCQIEN